MILIVIPMVQENQTGLNQLLSAINRLPPAKILDMPIKWMSLVMWKKEEFIPSDLQANIILFPKQIYIVGSCSLILMGIKTLMTL